MVTWYLAVKTIRSGTSLKHCVGQVTSHALVQAQSGGVNEHGSLQASRWPLIAMQTSTTPSFIISLPTREEDSLRYKITETGEYYEVGLTTAVLSVLDNTAHLPDGMVLDVGCNAGWYTLLSAAHFHRHPQLNREISCFEANPNIHPRLYDSIAFNEGFASLIKVVPKAVGATVGVMELSWSPGHYGVGTVNNIDAEKAAGESVIVPTTTLDAHFVPSAHGNHPPIIFMKVDVEGFECPVLKGSKQLLETYQVLNIFVEMTFDREEANNCFVEEWLPQLVEDGYELRDTYDVSTSPITKDMLTDFIGRARAKGMLIDIWLRLPV